MNIENGEIPLPPRATSLLDGSEEEYKTVIALLQSNSIHDIDQQKPIDFDNRGEEANKQGYAVGTEPLTKLIIPPSWLPERRDEKQGRPVPVDTSQHFRFEFDSKLDLAKLDRTRKRAKEKKEKRIDILEEGLKKLEFELLNGTPTNVHSTSPNHPENKADVLGNAVPVGTPANDVTGTEIPRHVLPDNTKISIGNPLPRTTSKEEGIMVPNAKLGRRNSEPGNDCSQGYQDCRHSTSRRAVGTNDTVKPSKCSCQNRNEAEIELPVGPSTCKQTDIPSALLSSTPPLTAQITADELKTILRSRRSLLASDVYYGGKDRPTSSYHSSILSRRRTWTATRPQSASLSLPGSSSHIFETTTDTPTQYFHKRSLMSFSSSSQSPESSSRPSLPQAISQDSRKIRTPRSSSQQQQAAPFHRPIPLITGALTPSSSSTSASASASASCNLAKTTTTSATTTSTEPTKTLREVELMRRWRGDGGTGAKVAQSMKETFIEEVSHCISNKNHTELARILCTNREYGWESLNIDEALHCLDRRGRTPLQLALQLLDYQSLLVLLRSGVDPNRKFPNGACPLSTLINVVASSLPKTISTPSSSTTPMSSSSTPSSSTVSPAQPHAPPNVLAPSSSDVPEGSPSSPPRQPSTERHQSSHRFNITPTPTSSLTTTATAGSPTPTHHFPPSISHPSSLCLLIMLLRGYVLTSKILSQACKKRSVSPLPQFMSLIQLDSQDRYDIRDRVASTLVYYSSHTSYTLYALTRSHPSTSLDSSTYPHINHKGAKTNHHSDNSHNNPGGILARLVCSGDHVALQTLARRLAELMAREEEEGQKGSNILETASTSIHTNNAEGGTHDEYMTPSISTLGSPSVPLTSFPASISFVSPTSQPKETSSHPKALLDGFCLGTSFAAITIWNDHPKALSTLLHYGSNPRGPCDLSSLSHPSPTSPATTTTSASNAATGQYEAYSSSSSSSSSSSQQIPSAISLLLNALIQHPSYPQPMTKKTQTSITPSLSFPFSSPSPSTSSLSPISSSSSHPHLSSIFRSSSLLTSLHRLGLLDRVFLPTVDITSPSSTLFIVPPSPSASSSTPLSPSSFSSPTSSSTPSSPRGGRRYTIISPLLLLALSLGRIQCAQILYNACFSLPLPHPIIAIASASHQIRDTAFQLNLQQSSSSSSSPSTTTSSLPAISASDILSLAATHCTMIGNGLSGSTVLVSSDHYTNDHSSHVDEGTELDSTPTSSSISPSFTPSSLTLAYTPRQKSQLPMTDRNSRLIMTAVLHWPNEIDGTTLLHLPSKSQSLHITTRKDLTKTRGVSSTLERPYTTKLTKYTSPSLTTIGNPLNSQIATEDGSQVEEDTLPHHRSVVGIRSIPTQHPLGNTITRDSLVVKHVKMKSDTSISTLGISKSIYDRHPPPITKITINSNNTSSDNNGPDSYGRYQCDPIPIPVLHLHPANGQRHLSSDSHDTWLRATVTAAYIPLEPTTSSLVRPYTQPAGYIYSIQKPSTVASPSDPRSQSQRRMTSEIDDTTRNKSIAKSWGLSASEATPVVGLESPSTNHLPPTMAVEHGSSTSSGSSASSNLEKTGGKVPTTLNLPSSTRNEAIAVEDNRDQGRSSNNPNVEVDANGDEDDGDGEWVLQNDVLWDGVTFDSYHLDEKSPHTDASFSLPSTTTTASRFDDWDGEEIRDIGDSSGYGVLPLLVAQKLLWILDDISHDKVFAHAIFSIAEVCTRNPYIRELLQSTDSENQALLVSKWTRAWNTAWVKRGKACVLNFLHEYDELVAERKRERQKKDESSKPTKQFKPQPRSELLIKPQYKPRDPSPPRR